MHFYISFAFVNTIGRFRVGFGVGHIYNMIEQTFLAKILIQIQIFELWAAAICTYINVIKTQQYVPIST